MKAAIIVLDFQPQPIKRALRLLSSLEESGFEPGHIDILVFGYKIDIRSYEKLSCNRVFIFASSCCTLKNYSPEPLLDAISRLQKMFLNDIILFTDDDLENELCTRVGFRLNANALLGVENFDFSDRGCIAKKPVYSYNLKADFELKRTPFLLSLLMDAYVPCTSSQALTPEIIHEALESLENGPIRCISIEPREDTDIFDSARVILVGGRGVGSKSGMEKLQHLADTLNGVLGGTRPTMLDCWIDSSSLVGVSGKIISPELCITFGASGSMPFVSGIEKSKYIISVNTDESATIFRSSDFGIVHDYSEIVDLLMQEINNSKQGQKK
jgi:electron transfer flavoprotein alpha subunit